MRAKNRMREICTSGSVRGGDGNILAYSALGLDDRRGLAFAEVELAVTAVGVGLQHSGPSREMRLRV